MIKDVLSLSVEVMLPYIAPGIFVILAAAIAMEFADIIRGAFTGGKKRRASY